ncbi:MAG TPA: TlpA disulfide reductase family protein [Tepidisphaeraceae bacterium]
MSVVVVAVSVALLTRPRPPASYGAGTNDYIGRMAPDFVLADLDGKPLSLASLKGRVVVLDLWASWCPPCVEELPTNTAIAAGYVDRGVAFYAVNLGESADQVRQFLTAQKLNPPVLLDPTGITGEKYGAQYIPLLVVIDAGGRIVAHGNLSPDEVHKTLPQWIESALKSGQADARGPV